MLFSEFLKERRKVLGLSQVDLSSLISYSSQVVSKWEKGISSPSIELSSDLANALKISLDDFFKLDPNARIYEKENPSFDIDAFPSQLKTYRTYKDLTQKEVGEKAGINYQSIQRFESGKSLPDINEFLSLVSIYELEPSFIYLSKNLVEATPIVQEKKPKINVIVPIVSSVVSSAIAATLTISIIVVINSNPSNGIVDRNPIDGSNNFGSVPPPEPEPTPDEYIFEELYTTLSKENHNGHEEFHIQLRCTYDGTFEECGIGTSLAYNDDFSCYQLPYIDAEYRTKTVIDGFYVFDIYLPDYVPSGDYYFPNVYGLVMEDDDGVPYEKRVMMYNPHKEERHILINNINGDVLPPTLDRIYMTSCTYDESTGIADVTYDVEFEESNSGIYKIIIYPDSYCFDVGYELVSDLLAPFEGYYENKDIYSPKTNKVSVTGRFPSSSKQEMDDFIKRIPYFTVTLFDKVGNKTELMRNISACTII